jgi:hypothetical protein
LIELFCCEGLDRHGGSTGLNGVMLRHDALLA